MKNTASVSTTQKPVFRQTISFSITKKMEKPNATKLQKGLTDCTYFMQQPDACRKGSTCNFRHSDSAKQKNKPCFKWRDDNCNNKACQYLHPAKKAPVPQKSETKPKPGNKKKPSKKQNKENGGAKQDKEVIAKESVSDEASKDTKEGSFSAMLLGETGSGKSTFINYLANYFLGGDIKKRAKGIHVAIPTKYLTATMGETNSELDLGDSTKSKTSECKLYQFRKGKLSFTFADTPGMSDTGGVDKDDENVLKILTQAEKLKDLSALVLIINGTISRVTVTVRNVLQRLKSSIPDSALQNIVILFTNCRSNLNRNFDLKSLEEFCNPQKVFHMDNLAFCTDPAIWDQNKQGIKHLEECWQESMEVIKDILDCVKESDAVITDDFRKMRELKYKIKNQLTESRMKVQQLQQLFNQLKQFQEDLAKNSKDEKSFSNYVSQTTKTVKKLVDAPYHSTICQTCQHVCHNHCGLREISTVGSNEFVGCAAFSGSVSCKVCEKGCSHTVHYHARKTFASEEQTVEQILDDIKAKFDKATQGKKAASQKINTVDGSLKMISQALENERKDLEKNCQQLKSLCKGFNLVDELHILIGQLELDAKAMQNLDAHKQAEDYIKNLKAFVNLMGQGKTAQKGDPKPAPAKNNAPKDSAKFDKKAPSAEHPLIGQSEQQQTADNTKQQGARNVGTSGTSEGKAGDGAQG